MESKEGENNRQGDNQEFWKNDANSSVLDNYTIPIHVSDEQQKNIRFCVSSGKVKKYSEEDNETEMTTDAEPDICKEIDR